MSSDLSVIYQVNMQKNQKKPNKLLSSLNPTPDRSQSNDRLTVKSRSKSPMTKTEEKDMTQRVRNYLHELINTYNYKLRDNQ